MQKALAERETLLSEIHHRVKNNLQVISSLISMEMLKTPVSSERVRLQAISQRVRIFARIHEQLYRSGDFAQVDIFSEIKQLCDSIVAVHDQPEITVRLDSNVGDVQPLTCNLDVAIPVALIVNELVTNSFKHAFPSGTLGHIVVSLRCEQATGMFVVSVSDDGVGLVHSATPGTGRRLVAGLAGQIDAEVSYAAGPGTRAVVTVPLHHFRS